MLHLLLLLICTSNIFVSGQFEQKPGDCPSPTEIGTCADTCFTDKFCPGTEKCCRTSCGGKVCVSPIELRLEKLQNEKPGSCPKDPKGPWVCSSTCGFDAECRGRLKCCKNRCGAYACQKAEKSEFDFLRENTIF